MSSTLVSATPETHTLDAIRLMRENSISCLPIVEQGKLVGMITETDFLAISRELITAQLEDAAGT